MPGTEHGMVCYGMVRTKVVLYKPKAICTQTATIVTRSVVWYGMVRATHAIDCYHIRSTARYGLVRTKAVSCKQNTARTQTAPVDTEYGIVRYGQDESCVVQTQCGTQTACCDTEHGIVWYGMG